MLVYLIPPIVGAAIGYFTNCLAIKMLFRPHRPVYLFNFQLPFTPGLLPKGQARLAAKLAETISDRIITPDALAKELTDSNLIPTGVTEIKKEIRKSLPMWAEHIRNFEDPRLDEQGPEVVKLLIQEHVGKLAGIFLDSNKIYNSVKEGMLDYLSQEENLEIIADKIDEGIDRFLFEPSDGIKQRSEKNVTFRSGGLTLIELDSNHIVSAFEKIAYFVAQHIDIKSIIENRINEFNPEEAEALILSVIRKELHWVMALGGVLGFIIGWIPVLIELF